MIKRGAAKENENRNEDEEKAQEKKKKTRNYLRVKHWKIFTSLLISKQKYLYFNLYLFDHQ